MNAIERLRDLSEQAQWKCSEDPSCPDCAADTEAVAAVDALYQAAKDWAAADAENEAAIDALLAGADDPNEEEKLRDNQKATRKALDDAEYALAAAVRRVEGQA